MTTLSPITQSAGDSQLLGPEMNLLNFINSLGPQENPAWAQWNTANNAAQAAAGPYKGTEQQVNMFKSLVSQGKIPDAIAYARSLGMADADIASQISNPAFGISHNGNIATLDEATSYLTANKPGQYVAPDLSSVQSQIQQLVQGSQYTPAQIDLSKIQAPDFSQLAANAPSLSSQEMQGLMDEYLNGNGQFTQALQGAKNSGLYNSDVTKMVANDMMTRAGAQAQNVNAKLKGDYAAQLAQMQAQAELAKYNAQVNAATKNADATNQAGLNNQQLQNSLGLGIVQSLIKSATEAASAKSSQTTQAGGGAAANTANKVAGAGPSKTTPGNNIVPLLIAAAANKWGPSIFNAGVSGVKDLVTSGYNAITGGGTPGTNGPDDMAGTFEDVTGGDMSGYDWSWAAGDLNITPDMLDGWSAADIENFDFDTAVSDYFYQMDLQDAASNFAYD